MGNRRDHPPNAGIRNSYWRIGNHLFHQCRFINQIFKAVWAKHHPGIGDLNLIIASLHPLHKRVQNAIDRRLYRNKYNAEKALSPSWVVEMRWI
jgi:hypothetical protein